MSRKNKIAVVSGIRSQYIKLASFQRAVNSLGARNHFTYIDAAQHYSSTLANQYLDEYSLKFDYSLRNARLPRHPIARFGAISFHLQEYLKESSCGHVVVFGDANTTLAASLAAKRLNLFLTHVEAGVRTGYDSIEELNRKLSDYMADYHIASCRADYTNLCKEGYSGSSEYIGDIVRDLCTQVLTEKVEKSEPSIVVTLHHDDGWPNGFFKSVIDALGKVSKEIYFYSHPRIYKPARKYSTNYPNIHVSRSASHLNLLKKILSSDYVVTDSGALQRESFYLGKRVLVIQESPFWKSLIEYGVNISCPPDIAKVQKGLIEIEQLSLKKTPKIDDFGIVPVGKKIVSKLLAL